MTNQMDEFRNDCKNIDLRNELKQLVNKLNGMCIKVTLDLVSYWTTKTDFLDKLHTIDQNSKLTIIKDEIKISLENGQIEHNFPKRKPAICKCRMTTLLEKGCVCEEFDL